MKAGTKGTVTLLLNGPREVTYQAETVEDVDLDLRAPQSFPVLVSVPGEGPREMRAYSGPPSLRSIPYPRWHAALNGAAEKKRAAEKEAAEKEAAGNPAPPRTRKAKATS